MNWPAGPFMYEISTWVWLDELSRKYGRRITLRSVPHEDWDEIAGLGFNAVCLTEFGSAARPSDKSPRYLHIRPRARGTPDGNCPSVWDACAHTPGKIKNGDTGEVANDQGPRADAVHQCACLPVLHRVAASLPRSTRHANNGTDYTVERGHYHS
jgi:hypothetical protein